MTQRIHRFIARMQSKSAVMHQQNVATVYTLSTAFHRVVFRLRDVQSPSGSRRYADCSLSTLREPVLCNSFVRHDRPCRPENVNKASTWAHLGTDAWQ